MKARQGLDMMVLGKFDKEQLLLKEQTSVIKLS